MFILDTNVISELRKAKVGKANKNVTSWAENIPVSHLYLSAITILELELGVLLVERRDQAQGNLLRIWLNDQVLPAFVNRVLSVDQGEFVL
jgi:predicted nucleic acid-binding protein